MKALTLLLLLCCALCHYQPARSARSETPAVPQNVQCLLKLSQLPEAPELFGFRMGMTTDQVKARVPQVIFERPNEFGLARTSINPDFDPRIDKSAFSGLRTISLDFLDGRLTSLWLGHDGSFKWQTVPDFVNGISQSLQLPDAWTSWKSRGQQLHCADFLMTVSIVAEGPSFRIVDLTAEQTLAARREAKEEQGAAAPDEPAAEIVADRKNKIYFVDSCRPANEISETDRVVFKTREAAEKAGYRLAKQCH